jgi:hypothetical protein
MIRIRTGSGAIELTLIISNTNGICREVGGTFDPPPGRLRIGLAHGAGAPHQFGAIPAAEIPLKFSSERQL